MKTLNIFFAFVALSLISVSPSFARSGLGSIFGSLIGGGTGNVVGRSVVGGMSVEQGLVKLCEKANKQFPAFIDKETRIDNVTPGPGRRFTYNYTFVNRNASTVDSNSFYSAMRSQLVNSACANSDMKIFFTNNVTISWAYKGRDGIPISRVDVTPRDCGYKQ